MMKCKTQTYSGAIAGNISYQFEMKPDGVHSTVINSRLPIYQALGFDLEDRLDLTTYDCNRNIHHLTEKISQDPKNSEYYLKRGILKRILGDEFSIKDFNFAVTLDPKNSYPLFHRGLYYHKNDKKRALTNYTEAIELDSSNYLAYLYRGSLYLRSEYEKCMKDWRKAFELNQDIKNFLRHPDIELYTYDVNLFGPPATSISLWPSEYTYTEDEQIKVLNWIEENDLNFELKDYYFNFIFCSTGLGQVRTIECIPLGLKLDLTEYEDW